jgi:hypothetical protein
MIFKHNTIDCFWGYSYTSTGRQEKKLEKVEGGTGRRSYVKGKQGRLIQQVTRGPRLQKEGGERDGTKLSIVKVPVYTETS